jgi:hypothetical protein
MQIQCTIQQGQMWFSIGEHSLEVNPILLVKATQLTLDCVRYCTDKPCTKSQHCNLTR